MSEGILKKLLSKRMLVAFGLGMTGGLPLLLGGSTLQAWMKDLGANLSTVGAVSLLGLPYTLKFLWSPFFDRFTLKPFGRRKGWLLLTQALCALAIFFLGTLGGTAQPSLEIIAVGALFLAFFSASQDIVIDAFRRESLADEELGLGSSLYVTGYRIAMLISGAGSLALAQVFNWQTVFYVMAAIMSLGMVLTFWSEEPKVADPAPSNFKEAVIDPFFDFFKRRGAWLFLAFIFFYKIGDQMAANMTTPLYLDIGFSKMEIGAIVKGIGFWAIILGGLLGGGLVIRWGLTRALFIFGILQMLSTLGFSLLHYVGKSNLLLGGVIGFENLTAGMGTAAFAAFMGSLTNRKYTATQYALLSSFMGIPRVVISAPTGVMVTNWGYFNFFIVCTLIALPGIFMISKLTSLSAAEAEDKVEKSAKESLEAKRLLTES
jgi:PAT family beta-lactamase induction signal transducer AmpG